MYELERGVFMLISIQEQQYHNQINGVKSAINQVDAVNQKPEMTADMLTLSKLLETYDRMAQILLRYKEMLQNDAEQMRCASDTMMLAEADLLK